MTMKKKQAQRKFPIVAEISELSGRFERQRSGVIVNFDWTATATAEAKNAIRATITKWHRKCQEFKNKNIFGVAVNVPATELLNLCGVKTNKL